MTRRTTNLSDELQRYLLDVSLRDRDVLRRLRHETAHLERSNMQIGADQGQLMGLLLELIEARRVLEVGTFTGYSALAMALALPEDGSIVACDVSEEWTSIGRRYWEEAGVADKIDLRLAPAAETLQSLLDEGAEGTFDFAFIDADKSGYDTYYELALRLLRPGGLVAVDNTLWEGKVADPAETDEDTEAIRAFNLKVHDDERVSLSLVPIGDGLTLLRKR
ncbi:MAG: class I SAM-dependent methyltransferase [Gemmatimonadota bacterium]|jgi:predicted O-methyltransferase YrrM